MGSFRPKDVPETTGHSYIKSIQLYIQKLMAHDQSLFYAHNTHLTTGSFSGNEKSRRKTKMTEE